MVGTVHLTVTSHVGDDQASHSRIVEGAQSLPHVATLTAPTARGQAISAHVQAHGNALTESIDGLTDGVEHGNLTDHPGEQLRVLAATERQIQVHEVHPAGPGLVKGTGDIDRAAPGTLVDRPGGQAHGLTARHVDRGQQFEDRHDCLRRSQPKGPPPWQLPSAATESL